VFGCDFAGGSGAACLCSMETSMLVDSAIA
jgi:hypothetical protein